MCFKKTHLLSTRCLGKASCSRFDVIGAGSVFESAWAERSQMPLSRSNMCPSMRPDDRLKTAVGVCLSPLCPPVWLSSCLFLVADLSLAFVFASLRVRIIMRIPVVEFAQIASQSFNESLAESMDRCASIFRDSWGEYINSTPLFG